MNIGIAKKESSERRTLNGYLFLFFLLCCGLLRLGLLHCGGRRGTGFCYFFINLAVLSIGCFRRHVNRNIAMGKFDAVKQPANSQADGHDHNQTNQSPEQVWKFNKSPMQLYPTHYPSRIFSGYVIRVCIIEYNTLAAELNACRQIRLMSRIHGWS